MSYRRQAIIWTNADPVHWRIYAALGEDELTTWGTYVAVTQRTGPPSIAITACHLCSDKSLPVMPSRQCQHVNQSQMTSVIVNSMSRFYIVLACVEHYKRDCPKVRYLVLNCSMFFLWMMCFNSWKAATFAIIQMIILCHARLQMWMSFHPIKKKNIEMVWGWLYESQSI